jgi:hypothetical protein
MPTRLNTNVSEDGGLNRSSEEVSVMEMERRVQLIRFKLRETTLQSNGGLILG